MDQTSIVFLIASVAAIFSYIYNDIRNKAKTGRSDTRYSGEIIEGNHTLRSMFIQKCIRQLILTVLPIIVVLILAIVFYLQSSIYMAAFWLMIAISFMVSNGRGILNIIKDFSENQYRVVNGKYVGIESAGQAGGGDRYALGIRYVTIKLLHKSKPIYLCLNIGNRELKSFVLNKYYNIYFSANSNIYIFLEGVNSKIS